MIMRSKSELILVEGKYFVSQDGQYDDVDIEL